MNRDIAAITQIKKMHQRKKRSSIYIALENVEDCDFYWSPREIENFDLLWEEETPINKIAKEMRRSPLSVFLLSFDRIARGLIKPRDGWKIW